MASAVAIEPSAAVAASSAPPPDAIPPLLADGCHNGTLPDAPVEALLDDLAARCAAGTEPLVVSPPTFPVSRDAESTASFDVPEGGACVRVLGAADIASSKLSLRLTTAAGVEEAKGTLGARFALVSGGGSVCLNGGPYRVIAHSTEATVVTVRVSRAR